MFYSLKNGKCELERSEGIVEVSKTVEESQKSLFATLMILVVANP